MKVGHITDSLGFGGAEQWLLNLAEISRDREFVGILDTVILTGSSRGEMVERFVALGVHVVHLPLGRSTLRSWRMGIMDVIAERKLTHLHSHQDWFAGWQWLLLIGVPILKISHIHNSPIAISYYTNSFRKPKRTMLFIVGSWLQCALSSSMLATSDQVISNYGIWKRLIPWRKPVVAYCGIPIMARKTAPTDASQGLPETFVLFVGRLSMTTGSTTKNEKNPEFAFELMNSVLERNQDVHFVVCGKKDEASEAVLMNLVDEDNRTRVHLLGTRSDVRVIMKRAKMLILPSVAEGLGLVAVEAQFEGCRVFASQHVPDEANVSHGGFEQLPLDSRLWLNAIESCLAGALLARFDIHESPHMSLEVSTRRLKTLYLSLT